jgi:hypothetical protein
MHFEGEFAGEGAQPPLGEVRQAVGPAMGGFVVVEALAQPGMAVPRVDVQVGVVEGEALDRHAEAAQVARVGPDFGWNHAARGHGNGGGARRDGEAIAATIDRLRRDDRAIDDEVEVRIEVEPMTEHPGAPHQRGADRVRLRRSPFQERRAVLPVRPVVVGVE